MLDCIEEADLGFRETVSSLTKHILTAAALAQQYHRLNPEQGLQLEKLRHSFHKLGQGIGGHGGEVATPVATRIPQGRPDVGVDGVLESWNVAVHLERARDVGDVEP